MGILDVLYVGEDDQLLPQHTMDNHNYREKSTEDIISYI